MFTLLQKRFMENCDKEGFTYNKEDLIGKIQGDKVNVVDKKGYKYSLSLGNYGKERGFVNIPNKFNSLNPFTLYNIKEIWLPKNAPDYVLLDNEYVNNQHKMLWGMKCGELPNFYKSWLSFQESKIHPLITKQNMRDKMVKSFEEVRKEVIDLLNKLKLIGWYLPQGGEFNYKAVDGYDIPLYHKNGYKALTSVSALKRNAKPKLYWITRPEESLFNLKIWLARHSEYTIKEGQEYRGYEEKHIFMCSLHGEFETTIDKIVQNVTSCKGCIALRNSGWRHGNYNPKLTEKERGRRRKGIEKIRPLIYERDDYRCQCCYADRSYKGEIFLNAHHLDAWHWCEEKRLSEDNLITLCESCHKYFHRVYGNKNNTREQFEEFMEEHGQYVRMAVHQENIQNGLMELDMWD